MLLADLCKRVLAFLVVGLIALPGITYAQAPEDPPVQPAAAESSSVDALRVCADPNNLPYSNEDQEGFENAIAEILADEMEVPLEYFWWPQRRGMVTRILRAGACDVIMGVPTGNEMLGTSAPYYRSGFVFLSRADRRLDLRSLDDPELRNLSIGVHVQEGEGNNPPALLLARRGLTENLIGFSVYGDYAQPNPLADIIEGVEDGSVDVAVVWGPAAGYFTGLQPTDFDMSVVETEGEAQVPMQVSISMGVRKGEDALATELSEALRARWDDVQAVLEEYNVPKKSLDPPPENWTPPQDDDEGEEGEERGGGEGRQ